MNRYFVQRRPVEAKEWWDNGPMLPALSVTDHKPIDTGVFDQHGDPIMRAPRGMGFGAEL